MKKNFQLKNVNLLITILMFILLFTLGSLKYDRFFSLSTFLNLFNNFSYLIIVAVGVTFVLITGGIDISVSSTVAFTCVFSAFLLQKGLTPLIVIPLVLLIGAAEGAFIGYIIQYYKIQPFIATLTGMFFMRGMCAVISTESIPITDKFYMTMALSKIQFGRAKLYYYVFIALIVVAVAYFTRSAAMNKAPN